MTRELGAVAILIRVLTLVGLVLPNDTNSSRTLG